jgi:lipoprotein-anchoring transpeptidase ErfK/SrfK
MKIKHLAIAGAMATSLIGFTGQQTSAATPASQDLIIINDFYNKLAFMDNGYIRFVEPVAMGKASTRTPRGTFKVTEKIKNRPYYKGKIAGGSPRNPLGTRWLGINVPGGGYGIHGHAVGNQASIGKDVSAGCVRLKNSRNELLYPYVNVGTKVVIVNSTKSFQKLAKDYKYTVKGFKLQK